MPKSTKKSVLRIRVGKIAARPAMPWEVPPREYATKLGSHGYESEDGSDDLRTGLGQVFSYWLERPDCLGETGIVKFE